MGRRLEYIIIMQTKEVLLNAKGQSVPTYLGRKPLQKTFVGVHFFEAQS